MHDTTARAFEKHYANQILFDEALASSLQAVAVARAARFLSVPAILSSDRDRLLIAFEHMEGWRTVTTLIRSRDFLGLPRTDLDAMFRRIGAALAEYHLGTSKIHGDFDSTNVLFKIGEPRICMIDFSRPNFADHPDYCRGTLYWDLALFLVHLRVKYPPQQLHLAYRAENRILSRSFLEGYFEQSPQAYVYEDLRAEFDRCLRLPYLARTFMKRFLSWTDRFNLEDLR